MRSGALAVGAPTGRLGSSCPRLAGLSELKCPGYGDRGTGDVHTYRQSTTGWQRAELIRATNANVGGRAFGARVRLQGSFLGATAPRDQMTGQGVGATGTFSLTEIGAAHLY